MPKVTRLEADSAAPHAITLLPQLIYRFLFQLLDEPLRGHHSR